MKKNQYVISIVVGVFVGALVALMVGSTTAILAGVVSAGFTAWIGSLQWNKARKFAIEVAGKSDVREHMQNITDLGSRIIIGTDKAIKWLLLAVKRLEVAFATDVNMRKIVLLGVVLFTFAYLLRQCLGLAWTELEGLSVEPTSAVVAMIILTAILSVLVLFAVVFSVFALIIIVATRITPECTATNKYDNKYDPEEFDGKSFFMSWFFQLMNDDRGAIAAIARMLYIRTGNALKILAYPCVLALWGAVALANNKTGVSALSATMLSGVHLSIAHFAGGGIATSNINFWLSLAIAMGLGVALGKKVHAMREPLARPLPSIKFHDQVALKRS